MQRSNPRLDRGRRRTIGVALVAGLIALLPASLSFAQDSCGDPWPLRRAMFMYTHSGMPTQTLDQIADRFEFVVEGYRPDLEYMLNKNSRLQYAAFYNSLTDNYVGDDSEHQWLMANAGQFGLDGEDAYLHFWEDTVVELQGQQITIPGWNPNRSAGDPPASATSTGARSRPRRSRR